MGILTRCRKCLIPDTRPDTPFIDGFCPACITASTKPLIDWDSRHNELLDLLEKHKTPSGYDCIVPSSGGKDSTYQALRLIELGVKPLIVTATTCMPTKVGKANISNLARFADTIEVTPSRQVRKALNRIGLEKVGDISLPEHWAIFTTPFKVACDMNIPLIFYGENPQSEYGGPQGTERSNQLTRRWRAEFGGFLGLRPEDFIGNEFTYRDMLPYMLPPQEEIERKNIQAHFLGYYEEWDSHRNLRVAKENGFQSLVPCKANYWEGENLDNGHTGIHDYFMYLKYGFGRACAQLSVDIRNGKIKRFIAERIMAKKEGFYPTYMGFSLSEILASIDITEYKFQKICEQFTNKDIF